MSSGSVSSYRPRDGKDPEEDLWRAASKNRRGTKKLQEAKKKAEEEHGRELNRVSANTKRDFRRTESSVIATAATTSDPAGLDLQLQLSKTTTVTQHLLLFLSVRPSVLPYLPLSSSSVGACSGVGLGPSAERLETIVMGTHVLGKQVKTRTRVCVCVCSSRWNLCVCSYHKRWRGQHS